MYRRPSKKKLLAQRIAVYTTMIVSVAVAVTALIFLILGYRFDSDNGRVEQAALLQFNSTPTGATISIDGKTISNKTPGKYSVLPGSHQFTVTKDGYETWQKTLDVKAGTLTWLNYIRLVPKDRPVVPVADYTALHASLATLEGQYILLQPNAVAASFQLVDVQSDTIKSTTLTIPTTTYSEPLTTGVSHTFTMNAWDKGGRYVLIQHAYADKKEWLVLDTRDASATKNITTLLDLDMTDVVFAGTSGNVFYGLSGNDIRKLDTSAGTISRSLVGGVTQFDLFETNVITYVGIDQTDPTKRVVGLYREGDANAHILRTITSTDTSLHIATTRYFNKDYVAIAEGSKIDVVYGSYPSSSSDDTTSLTTFATLDFTTPVEQLGFSPAGDYLVAQAGNRFMGYDLEHQRLSSATVSNDDSLVVSPLKWLDDDHIWSDATGSLTMHEFDGANVISINAIAKGFDVVLTQNDRFLYSIGTKDGGGYQLQRVRMVLP